MRLLKGMTKRGQSGQSLVILAIGFLALLGFVGIVTDVSVLFIRYNTMRRAVDAAAIAAAGQMRRVADPTPLDSNADDEAISVANLNLAARQFIEVYGLNPKSVLVETCRVQNVGRDASGNPYDEAYWLNPPTNTIVNPDADPLFVVDGSGNIIPNPAVDPEIIKNYKQLCTSDELKLVRVTAQIDAPTIFLRLLGYPNVTLTESAVSQTAVIDVVLVFDVSESMLNQTTYDDWDTLSPPQGVRYMPPYINRNDINDDAAPLNGNPYVVPRQNPWTFIADNPESAINTRIDPSLVVLDNVIQDKTIMFEPTTATPGATDWQIYTNAAASPIGREQPRPFCQVRAYPSTVQQRGLVPADLRQEYYNFFQNVYSTFYPTETYAHQFEGNDGGSAPTSNAYFSGFVPMYNSFACCNDPNGDFYFDDLICQPFKDARDAAHEFLDRLDFLRGDRVAYVTFNRRAYLVDPDGADIFDAAGNLTTAGGAQAAMIETQNNLDDPSDPDPTVLLRKGAAETLDDVVGVLAEPSSYVDTNNDGLWDALNDGGAAHTYNDLLNSVPIGQTINAPVNGACPDDLAVLDPPYLNSAWKLLPPDGSSQRTTLALLDEVLTVPSWFYSGGYPDYLARYRSYENRASCAGTNIGGALAAGSAALFNEGRREGAVWIMVLLSDGAAGASNPVYRIGGDAIQAANPYAPDGTGSYLEPSDGIGGPLCTDPASPNYPCDNPFTGQSNSTGGYGFFGLCPYGPASPTFPDDSLPQLLQSSAFPTCSDLMPQTRHYCGQVAYIPDSALDPQSPAPPLDPAGCINYYDVDDYARDWADWVAVADLPNAKTGGTTGRVGDQLLPTIFTIGFGINYDVDSSGNHQYCTSSDYNCIRGFTAGTGPSGYQRSRRADYLGEELLRYIADVGDNFEIDNDYWQLNGSTAPLYPGGPTNTCTGGVTDRLGNCIKISAPEWGTFGACETETSTHTGNWNPKPPRESCGNYYVAASGQQLEDVFNQIASRMFTRLSQ